MMMGAPFVYRHIGRSILRHSWDGPTGEGWLSACERDVYAGLRDARRREAWLFGRIVAKQLILDAIRPPVGEGTIHPAAIQIHSRDGLGRAIRPRVVLDGRLQHWFLSIAHSDQSVLVALSGAPGVCVGADITPVQAMSNGFQDMWLTAWERRWLRKQGDQKRSHLLSTIWAVKEAFYKAVNVGEQFVPSHVEVRTDALGGYSLRLKGAELGGLSTVHVAEAGTEVSAIVTVAV
ncbi:MAG: 4'-phosphopantetheinyl transferase family protein [Rhodothermales bacterium]